MEYMDALAKNSHPKIEVMAGGGAILAKTGERVSKYEAELIATRAERPEVAAMAEAGPSRASSAVAEAVAADAKDAMDAPVPDSDEELPGRADADNARRPIVKATTKRAPKARPNSVKKKSKAGK